MSASLTKSDTVDIRLATESSTPICVSRARFRPSSPSSCTRLLRASPTSRNPYLCNGCHSHIQHSDRRSRCLDSPSWRMLCTSSRGFDIVGSCIHGRYTVAESAGILSHSNMDFSLLCVLRPGIRRTCGPSLRHMWLSRQL